MPFNSGSNPIKITLLNEGYQTLTSATIKWTLNDVTQTPYTWNGNLSMGTEQNNIQIGNYNFSSGVLKRIKIWVENPNGNSDFNRLNDTLKVNIGASLCGLYTIGGMSSDFDNFNDASVALNNAGIGCPVVFKVRPGSYNEQVKLYEVRGSSSINTITFIPDTVYSMSASSFSLPQSLRPGLRAYYSFNGSLKDSSGVSSDGVGTNVTYTTDRYGNANGAGSFNGSNSYVSAVSNVSEQSYTLSFYFKSSTSNCGLFSVSKGNLLSQGYDRGIYLENGRLVTYLYSDERIYTPDNINFSDNKWHHVVFEYDSAVMGQRLYVDGSFVKIYKLHLSLFQLLKEGISLFVCFFFFL
jgi:hypothetical protein